MRGYTTIVGEGWQRAAVIGLTILGLMSPPICAEEPAISGSKVAPALQPTPQRTAGPVPERITSESVSKAYMNCLIEVDRTMSKLAGVTNVRAVRAEAESQRAFCANRKRDCTANAESAECRIFVEEFQLTVLDEGSIGRPRARD